MSARRRGGAAHTKSPRKGSKRSTYGIALGALAGAALGFGASNYLHSTDTKKETKEAIDYALGYDPQFCGVGNEYFSKASWDKAQSHNVIRLNVGGHIQCYDVERLHDYIQAKKRDKKTIVDPKSGIPLSKTQIARVIEQNQKIAELEERVGYDRAKCDVTDESTEKEPYTGKPWAEAKKRPVIRLHIKGKTRCYDLERLYHDIRAAEQEKTSLLVAGLLEPLSDYQIARVKREYEMLKNADRIRAEQLRQEELKKKREAAEAEKKERKLTFPGFDGTLRKVNLTECKNLVARHSQQPILPYSEFGMQWKKCSGPGCDHALLSLPLYDTEAKQNAERQVYYLYTLRNELLDGKPLVPRIYDAWVCTAEGSTDFGTAYMVVERYDTDMETRAADLGSRHVPPVHQLFEATELRRMFRIAFRIGQLGIANLGLQARSFVHRQSDGNVALFGLGFAGGVREGEEKYRALGVGTRALGTSCPAAYSIVKCKDRDLQGSQCAEYMNLIVMEMRLIQFNNENRETYLRGPKGVNVFGGLFVRGSQRFDRDLTANPCPDYTNEAVSQTRKTKLSRAKLQRGLSTAELRLFDLADIIRSPSPPK